MAGGKKKKTNSKRTINLHALQAKHATGNSTTIRDTSNNVDTDLYEVDILATEEIKLPTISRSQRINYDPSRCPDEGPYTLKISPIPYDSDEQAIADSFSSCINYEEIISITIPKGDDDAGERFQGECFMEVHSLDALSAVMSKNNEPAFGDRRNRLVIEYKDRYGSYAGDPNSKGGYGRPGGDRFGGGRRERQPEREEVNSGPWRRGPGEGAPARATGGAGGSFGRSSYGDRDRGGSGYGGGYGGGGGGFGDRGGDSFQRGSGMDSGGSRPRLNLKPKTGADSSAPSTPKADDSTPKADPLGGAAPKDDAAGGLTKMQLKELEMEKKLAAQATAAPSRGSGFGERGSGGGFSGGRGGSYDNRRNDDRQDGYGGRSGGRRSYEDDRGGDRYGDRGGDRFGGDRGGDRYNDRSGGFGSRDGGGGFGSRDGGGGGGFNRDRGFDRGGNDGGNYGNRDGGRDDFVRPSAGERPRLGLKPRSTAPEPAQESPSARKSDPFGGARPVDATKQLEKERAIEERLKQSTSSNRMTSSDSHGDRDLRNPSSRVAQPEEPRKPREKKPPTFEKEEFQLKTTSKFAGLGLDDEANKEESSSSEEEEEVVPNDQQDWAAE